MHLALRKIKDAIATKDAGANLTYYRVAGGYIGCTNGAVTMATPYQADFEALLPGPELEHLVSRLPEKDFKVQHNGDSVTLSSGRLRGKVPLLSIDQMSFVEPEHEWGSIPEAFFDALATVRGFVSEINSRAWATCACLRQGSILGTNNIVIVDVRCPDLEPPESLLLPYQSVDLLLKRSGDKATGLILTPGYIAVHWADGTWLRSQLMADKFPEAVVDKYLQEQVEMQTIDPSWRAQCATVVDMTESLISIEPSRVHGKKQKAEVDAEMDTGVASPVHFDPKYLGPVLKVASEWALNQYPKPIRFRNGAGLEGIIMGRQA